MGAKDRPRVHGRFVKLAPQDDKPKTNQRRGGKKRKRQQKKYQRRKRAAYSEEETSDSEGDMPLMEQSFSDSSPPLSPISDVAGMELSPLSIDTELCHSEDSEDIQYEDDHLAKGPSNRQRRRTTRRDGRSDREARRMRRALFDV